MVWAPQAGQDGTGPADGAGRDNPHRWDGKGWTPQADGTVWDGTGCDMAGHIMTGWDGT